MALPVVSFSLSALPTFRFVYGSFQRKTALVLIPVLRALVLSALVAAALVVGHLLSFVSALLGCFDNAKI